MIFDKATKNFFFDSFLREESFKEVQEDLGEEVTKVAIIISPEKQILRAMGETTQIDDDFTVEQMRPFLKMIRVKPESIKDYKHIFILLNFKGNAINFESEHSNGTKKQFSI